MVRRALLTLGLLALVGCGGGEADPESTPTATATQPAEATPTAQPTPPPAVTWHQDIKPLVQRSCLRCHTDNGVGPGDFTRYEDAAPMAPVMAAFVSAGIMPPGAADPGCRDYQDSERMFLSEEERALFTDWADLGAPEGIPTEDGVDPSVGDRLSDEDADLLLYPKLGHRPDFDAGGNDYHCFVLDTDMDETFYITAMDVRLGTPKMVHHMVLYLDQDGVLGEEGEIDEDKGFQCFHQPGGWSFLTAWAPGAGPAVMPEGTGLKVEPHQKVILQVHYFDSFEGAALTEDRSGYALKVASEVEQEMYLLAYGPTKFQIPAGDPSYTSTESYTNNGEIPPIKLWGTFPHMHVLGESYRYWLTDSRGTDTCLLDGPKYDFHNQLTYFYRQPAVLGVGDTVSFSCTWDNSASNPNQTSDPPKDITYGEGTTDEMCWAFSYVTLGR